MRQIGSIRYEIVIPRTYNDGSPIPDSVLEEYRSELLDIFNGITQYGSVTGFWTPPPDWKWELKGESNLILTIDARNEAKQLYAAIFEDILERLRVKLGQHSIHFTSFACDSFLVVELDKESKCPLEVRPTDRLYLFDKNGVLVAYGTKTQLEKMKMQDGDLLLFVSAKHVGKYRLHQLEAIGRKN